MNDLFDEFAEYLRARPPLSPQSTPVPTLVPMQEFIRGQRAKLSALSDRTRQFTLKVRAQSAALGVFDFVCFGLDAQGKLSDDNYMVFFNQKFAPDDAIQLSELSDKSALFAFDLDVLPATIARLVFTISIDGSGTMRELGASELTLSEAGLLNPQALLRYQFSGADFDQEGALMLAEIYRKDGIWRVWAAGQGFAGDLGALLSHFGGEAEADKGAVAASSAPPLSQSVSAPLAVSPPSPPISSPAMASVPINAATPLVIPAAMLGELQKTLDNAPIGATIRLPRGEYRGPIEITRALTIEGEGAVIWAQNGPVVAVKSAGVVLRGIQIEATGDETEIALFAEGAPPTLERVGVRGRVVGVTRETGEWKLPASLDLGAFAPRARNSWKFQIAVPLDCQLKTNVSGLQIQPAQIQAGAHEIEIVANGIGADTFLAGQIEVAHAGLVRPIPLCGRTDLNAAAVQDKRI